MNSVIGSILVVIGLYTLLWGRNSEAEETHLMKQPQVKEEEDCNQEEELKGGGQDVFWISGGDVGGGVLSDSGVCDRSGGETEEREEHNEEFWVLAQN